jgi:hypothetical protein
VHGLRVLPLRRSPPRPRGATPHAVLPLAVSVVKTRQGCGRGAVVLPPSPASSVPPWSATFRLGGLGHRICFCFMRQRVSALQGRPCQGFSAVCAACDGLDCGVYRIFGFCELIAERHLLTKALVGLDPSDQTCNLSPEHQDDDQDDDGTQDFYAHMRSRTGDGRQVRVGDKIGEVGEEGNITGPHLHFERHKTQADHWSCDLPINPGPSLHAPPMGVALSRRILLSELRFGEMNSNSVRRLQRALNMHRQGNDEVLRLTGDYGPDTDRAVRICQQRHGFGDDLEGVSSVGVRQAGHLFGIRRRIVNDL